ncbi:MAG: hypothetical protein DRG33_03475 [Deltaproteobacteria bacterium]|nr:MAG: hypothetical protein DRG33_03475 [Deltaproteobacteria bacterium]
MIDLLSILFLAAGLFFFCTALVGLLRLPDFYCRMHAVGKADTMGMLLVILGLIIHHLGSGITWPKAVVSFKILFIAAFWFLGGPTATHALLRSAFERGQMPWTKDGKAVIEWPEEERK